jgi:hypothetical protein
VLFVGLAIRYPILHLSKFAAVQMSEINIFVIVTLMLFEKSIEGIYLFFCVLLTSILQISRPGCLPTSAPKGDSGILNRVIRLLEVI